MDGEQRLPMTGGTRIREDAAKAKAEQLRKAERDAALLRALKISAGG
jgi:hypothetical protein